MKQIICISDSSKQGYYPFGMLAIGRSWEAGSGEGYEFGYQGSIKDPEINRNNYSTFYRELDTRIARWWSMDFKKGASENPYLQNHNNPIKYNDPKGDWPPAQEAGTTVGSSTYAQLGVQLNLGGGSTSNIRVTASVGGNVSFGAIQGDFSTSLNLNLGGIGSNQGTTGNPQPIGDLNLSVGLTGGIGNATPMTMNVFHSMSGNNVSTTYTGSASVGLTQTFSTMMFSQPGRDQTTGYAYLRYKGLSLGTYNDMFSEWYGLPNNDSYYTGGFEIQVQTTQYSMLTFGYDAFTGARPEDKAAQIGPDNNLYYAQTPSEQLFNNGQTTLKLSTQGYVIGVNHVGNGMINGQWLQNLIHDNWKGEDENGKCLDPISRFLNSSTESLQLSLGMGQTWLK